MKNYFISLLFIFLTNVSFAEPTKFYCGYGPSTGVPWMPHKLAVHIVGHKGDLIELHQNSRTLAFDASTREEMGGSDNELNCGDVRFWVNWILIRTGKKNDLVSIYGFNFDPNDNVSLISVAKWFPRDGVIAHTSMKDDSLEIVYGQKGDLRKKFCWNFKGDGKWWWYSGRAETISPECNQPIPNQAIIFQK